MPRLRVHAAVQGAPQKYPPPVDPNGAAVPLDVAKAEPLYDGVPLPTHLQPGRKTVTAQVEFVPRFDRTGYRETGSPDSTPSLALCGMW